MNTYYLSIFLCVCVLWMSAVEILFVFLSFPLSFFLSSFLGFSYILLFQQIHRIGRRIKIKTKHFYKHFLYNRKINKIIIWILCALKKTKKKKKHLHTKQSVAFNKFVNCFDYFFFHSIPFFSISCCAISSLRFTLHLSESIRQLHSKFERGNFASPVSIIQCFSFSSFVCIDLLIIM